MKIRSAIILPINGAGSKSRVKHFILTQNVTSGIVDNCKEKLYNNNLIVNYTSSNIFSKMSPCSITDCQSTENSCAVVARCARVETVVADESDPLSAIIAEEEAERSLQENSNSELDGKVNVLFNDLHLIDTNYFPTVINTVWGPILSVKNHYLLRSHLQTIYKCALIQYFNVKEALHKLGFNSLSESEIYEADVEKTILYYSARLFGNKKPTNYPYIQKVIKTWIRNHVHKSLYADLEKAKCLQQTGNYLAITEWIDPIGFKNLFRVKQKRQPFVKVYTYGNEMRSCCMNNITTVDGELKLVLPYYVRYNLQLWYNTDAKDCRKTMRELMSTKFNNYDYLFRILAKKDGTKDKTETLNETKQIVFDYFKIYEKLKGAKYDALPTNTNGHNA